MVAEGARGGGRAVLGADAWAVRGRAVRGRAVRAAVRLGAVRTYCESRRNVFNRAFRRRDRKSGLSSTYIVFQRRFNGRGRPFGLWNTLSPKSAYAPQRAAGPTAVAYAPAPMRALVVTNMYPTAAQPARGSFVRDQVDALRRIPGMTVEVFTFGLGSAAVYARAAAELRRRYRLDRFDVVHAHFGLTGWPALAAPARHRALTLHGTDLAHPRSRAITLGVLRRYDLPAVVSEALAHEVPSWAVKRSPAVLPCGVDTNRFHPIARAEARVRLGLEPQGPYLLFPADPGRPEKRHDRALAVAGEVPLLALGGVEPEEVPLWVNAANAVLVPSEREGFGLAVLEALACDVPVLATPVGIAPDAIAGVTGAYCGPFDSDRWREALASHLATPDPRVAGREHAERFSADRMAARVAAAWDELG